MTQATQRILDGLDAFMQRQRAWGVAFSGTTFVVSKNEFGIQCAPQKLNVYYVLHLVDSLARARFFDGKRKPGTDLDTMVNKFGLGKTRFYKGVVAKITRQEITLTVKTGRPVNETLGVLYRGADAAQKELDQERREAEQRYAQMVRDEFAKENGLIAEKGGRFLRVTGL